MMRVLCCELRLGAKARRIKAALCVAASSPSMPGKQRFEQAVKEPAASGCSSGLAWILVPYAAKSWMRLKLRSMIG